MQYLPTIGLEIHAELSTRTKMFCRSLNDPDEKRPNMNVCPICMGHPGTLPAINKEAVKHVLRIGTALGAQLADFSEFDRKNYFYPDIPKGYQISQYKYPLVSGGSLNGVVITRVHLEEDTARSTHDDTGKSYVDFNRAGVPLMELVTEPVIRSSKEAVAFGRELRLLLLYLKASKANLEKGEMRVEANVSVAMANDKLGTKVEIKNLNSFKSVEAAIEYEIRRQIKVLETGGVIIQETRGWNENIGQTFSQRSKEEAFDYRYFPEPDLPKLKISEVEEFQNLASSLPELPWQKRERLLINYDLKKETTELFLENKEMGDFFDAVSLCLGFQKNLVQLASNYISSDLAGLVKSFDSSHFKMEPRHLAELVRMIEKREVASRAAKDILSLMINRTDESPREIALRENFLQESGEENLKLLVKDIIAKNEGVVSSFRSGKENSLQFLIGLAIKETKGRANPQMLKAIFLDELKRM